ncbi:MAG: heavy-metal-associated domain-containing protein [Parasphingorhabdus sp.]|nr:heavy-metal-associated domain-containing protein [Parasphingorhabdus sp.]
MIFRAGQKLQHRQALLLLLMLFLCCGTVGLVYAQLEGSDRGVAPVANSGDYEVSGIKINVTGDNSEDARQKGWQEAQRLGWQKLYARTHGGASSGLPDGTLNNIVSAIVVDQEQIGPRRYVATLGVIFDRVRTSQILGGGGQRSRSPPLLVLPIQWTGGAPIVFEQRTEWQKAWARFRAGDSTIDYVRPYGSGSDSLLLTAGQADRHDRQWWRNILDQFGAADVLIPVARIVRSWPGGPVTGYFAARYGPDNKYLGSFSLKVNSSDAIPEMLDQAVERLDQLYATGLSRGVLRTDRSLSFEDPLEEALRKLEAELAEIQKANAPPPGTDGALTGAAATAALNTAAANNDLPPIAVSVQFDTPDAAAVGRAESAVRSVQGVSSASTSSLALGGVSVMRVTYKGELSALATALRGKGYQVSEGAGALRLRGGTGGNSAPKPDTPPQTAPQTPPAEPSQ